MTKAAVAVGAAEVPGAVALVITTFTIPAVAEMALAWRVLAAFVTIEGGNRLSNEVSIRTRGAGNIPDR